MEQPNSEPVKVESSTNDAGQNQDDEKRDGHGGERFGGRGRGGRGVSILFWLFVKTLIMRGILTPLIHV